MENDDKSYIGKLGFRLRLLNPSSPLYLPKGSIRGLIAIGLVATAIYCTAYDIDMSDRMWDLVLGFSSLYVGSRLNFSNNSKDDENT